MLFAVKENDPGWSEHGDGFTFTSFDGFQINGLGCGSGNGTFQKHALPELRSRQINELEDESEGHHGHSRGDRNQPTTGTIFAKGENTARDHRESTHDSEDSSGKEYFQKDHHDPEDKEKRDRRNHFTGSTT
jgi:hypothetical protein